MSSETFLLYVLTWALVALTPGPAVFCAVTQATRHGFRASLAGISGTQAGNLVFFIAIALGLATLLQTATIAFEMLRIAGAAYLIFLGCRAFRSTFSRRDAASRGEPLPAKHRSLFLQGLAIQLTNPKALLFVSALLPQFIDARLPLLPQLALLVVTTVLVDCLVLSSYALVADRCSQSIHNSPALSWLERAFGTALVLLGLRILLSRK